MVIVVVVPFLNEGRYLPILLESLATQTRAADRLVLVDDGSTDDSTVVATTFTEQTPGTTLLRRPRRPRERDRLVSAAEWLAFQSGVAHVGDDYDVVAKVDADMELSSKVLAEVEHHFISDPGLGLVGPYVAERDRMGRPVRLRGRPEHVHGSVKFYRRQCYEQILPIRPALGWDIVDGVKARSLGWRTACFAASSGDPIHLRAMGSEDGARRGYRRWGQGDYLAGVHPAIVLVVALQRLRDKPPLIGSLNYLWGWVAAALRRLPRAEPEVLAFARKEQSARVRQRLPTWSGAGRTR